MCSETRLEALDGRRPAPEPQVAAIITEQRLQEGEPNRSPRGLILANRCLNTLHMSVQAVNGFSSLPLPAPLPLPPIPAATLPPA